MDDVLDIACSLGLLAGLVIALLGHALGSGVSPLVSARVDREHGLPLVGRAPMHAVYRTLVPVARALVAARISANAVSCAALALAVLAAVAFGDGRFGLGAAIACAASLADAIDGLVARESGTQSRFGQVLDTTIDRFVDALFLGGLAVYVRHDVAPLLVVLGALVGSFMVSYASSIERELGHTSSSASMRRAHRLAYLLTGAALGPIALRLAGEQRPYAAAVPMLLAASVIAVFGNVSAVRRVLAAARATDPAPPSERKRAPTPLPESAPR
jgi:CDP-diacylglycerol--glycerol-3-phosphate 3-phosphatidyltransferase